jgi:flavin reductase (DIM6/NTAB) family NADH-FMN oxidoreductase RutF
MSQAEVGPERVLAAEFRTVMGRFATGVTVVTAVQDGFDHAMTANSFASVSLEPPLVLVCVEVDSRFHEAVLDAGGWNVNVLDEAQRGRASWFATKGRPLVGQFDSTPTHRSALTGALLLDEALVTVECRTQQIHRAGDHDILIGEVLEVDMVRPDGRPLLWFGSGYYQLGADIPRR